MCHVLEELSRSASANWLWKRLWLTHNSILLLLLLLMKELALAIHGAIADFGFKTLELWVLGGHWGHVARNLACFYWVTHSVSVIVVGLILIASSQGQMMVLRCVSTVVRGASWLVENYLLAELTLWCACSQWVSAWHLSLV